MKQKKKASNIIKSRAIKAKKALFFENHKKKKMFTILFYASNHSTNLICF